MNNSNSNKYFLVPHDKFLRFQEIMTGKKKKKSSASEDDKTSEIVEIPQHKSSEQIENTFSSVKPSDHIVKENNLVYDESQKQSSKPQVKKEIVDIPPGISVKQKAIPLEDSLVKKKSKQSDWSQNWHRFI